MSWQLVVQGQRGNRPEISDHRGHTAAVEVNRLCNDNASSLHAGYALQYRVDVICNNYVAVTARNNIPIK